MDWSIVKSIWPTLRKCLNSANKRMKELLTNNFQVREFRPMVFECTQDGDSPTELKERLKKSLERNDNRLFKKEKKTNVLDDDDLGSRRAVDDREGWSVEDLNAAICNRMVLEIFGEVSGDSLEE